MGCARIVSFLNDSSCFDRFVGRVKLGLKVSSLITASEICPCGVYSGLSGSRSRKQMDGTGLAAFPMPVR